MGSLNKLCSDFARGRSRFERTGTQPMPMSMGFGRVLRAIPVSSEPEPFPPSIGTQQTQPPRLLKQPTAEHRTEHVTAICNAWEREAKF